MYKIIGGDQKEYGPASADDLKRWIAEGRLNARSLARAEPGGEWKPLAQFPELADALAALAQPPPPLGGHTPPPALPQIWTAEILAREPQVAIGLCLTRSWELVKANFGLLFTATLLIWLVGLIEFIPFVGLAYRIVAGVLYGGLCMVFLKRIRSEPATPREAFCGFDLAFGQLVLAGVIIWVLSEIGFCLCIVPGIYLIVAWIFALPLVIDKRLEFWSAMELSRKVVTRVWFPVFLLLVLAFLPVIAMNFLSGVKAAYAIVPAVQHLASSTPPDLDRVMETVMRIKAATLSLTFLTRLVLLINLPFAVGALMYAYENLFGPRSTAAA